MTDTATPTVAVLSDIYRDAQRVSKDYRIAEEFLTYAIESLNRVGYNTVELRANLEEVQEHRAAHREARKAAYTQLRTALLAEGLAQSAAGEVESLGSFAQYADDEEDRD